MSTKSSSPQLGAAVKPLTGLCNALSFLTAAGVERLTVVQVLFFCQVARAEAMNHAVTLGDIMDAYGDLLNKSIVNTYKIFLEKSRQYPEGLGWIIRVPNPDDERQNFLKLTPRGRKAAEVLLLSLSGASLDDPNTEPQA